MANRRSSVRAVVAIGAVAIGLGACGGDTPNATGDSGGGGTRALPTATPAPTVIEDLPADAVGEGLGFVEIDGERYDFTIEACFVLGANMAGSGSGDGVTVEFETVDVTSSEFNTLQGTGSLKVDVASGASWNSGTDDLATDDLGAVDADTLVLHDVELNGSQKFASGQATMIDLSSGSNPADATFQVNCS
jgi:hypothetical protein